MIDSVLKLRKKEDRIRLMIDLSKKVIQTRSEYEKQKIRSEFRSLKISARNKKCVGCRANATEIHHLIPIKNGGINNKENLAPLCHVCHSRIHPWMREFKDGRKYISENGRFIVGKRSGDSIYHQKIQTLSWWMKLVKKDGTDSEIEQIEDAFSKVKERRSHAIKKRKLRKKMKRILKNIKKKSLQPGFTHM